MRIAIDLQACQQGRPAAFTESVAALRTLVDAAVNAGHTALLVLHHADGDQGAALDAWRHALAPLATAPAPHVQLHLLDTPHGQDAWRQHAAALLRDTLLQDLRADVVWLAGQPGAADQAQGASAVPAVYDESHTGLHDMDAGHMLARLLAAATLAVTATAPAATSAKPRLAYLSPLPPQQSGIADYSVELLAQLEQFYDIDLIVDGPLAPALASRYTARTVAWFAEHGGQYARRLYHFGNNGQHCYLFGLLQRHPGIVVLHDFYLSAALDKLELVGHQPHALLHALYASHGYSGVLAAARMGRNASITAAAKSAGISYKAAWDAIDELNNLAQTPLVQRSIGGKGGGGAHLSVAGLRVLRLYQRLQALQAQVLDAAEDAQDLDLLGRLMLRTSARNQLHGSVIAIHNHGHNDLIELALPGGLSLRAQITRDSTKRLELAIASPAVALIKAGWLQLIDVAQLPSPEHNHLRGQIEQILHIADGPSEVRISLPGGQTLCALTEPQHLETLGLSVGSAAQVQFAPSLVLLGTPL